MMKTQCQEVLEYLREHDSISARTASRNLNIDRLAARIRDLRDSGHQILSETVTQRSKRNGRIKRFCRYRLVE